MKNIIYLALGGPKESMKLRVDALKQKREENGGEGNFILDGFSSEIAYMERFFTNEFPSYAYAFDTLSNIQCCQKSLNDADVIWVATSKLHWERIKIILRRKFPQLLEKVEWIPTEELETKYAKLGLWIYKILGPRVLQKIAIITRWKRYRREYLAPNRERAFCAFMGVYY